MRKKSIPLIFFPIIVFVIVEVLIILKRDEVLIGNGGDGFNWIFFADNFKDRVISFQNPFYTTRIFYPHGRELYFFDYSLFILFLISLFSLFFNYITSYNLTLISIFMLNFISMYWLVKFITKRETLALLISTLFSISPFNYSSALGHLSMLSVFVFPLTVLAFLRKNKVLLILSLLLSFMVRLEYFLYMFFLLPTISFVFFGFDKNAWKVLFLSFFISLTIFFVFFHPSLILYIKSPHTFRFMNKEIYLEPWALFLPNPLSLDVLWVPREVFSKVLFSSYYTGDESLKGIGWISLILLFYSLYIVIKNKVRFKIQKKLFISAFIIYFLLFTPIFDLILSFPFLDVIRVKSRIVMISIFLIYLGISITLKEVKLSDEIILVLLVIHLILSLPINFPTTKIYNIENLHNVIIENNVTVLNVPCLPIGYYLQTIHKKPTIDGLFLRAEPEATYFYYQLLESCKNDSERFKNMLSEVNFKYVIITRPYIEEIKSDPCIDLYNCIKKNKLDVDEIAVNVFVYWPVAPL
jgi:hypothetical protein